ncbi:MAG TPA: putative glycolipid-binding domain-containing protein [Thermoleophilia bacterium]|nr:putative glycolipid-binding domain-containing protein [Thermoleophilia bacterium]
MNRQGSASDWDRAVGWAKDDPFGVEFAEIRLASDGLRAKGVAIGTSPVPYRLDYELETTGELVTSRLRVWCTGEGWSRTLDLRHDAGAPWVIDAAQHGEIDLPRGGGEPAALAGALDCDLGLSPVTNLMPILRHDLLLGRGPIELTAAWVSVPDLGVQADGQRYTHLRSEPDHHLIRYEATDGSFCADIMVDDVGVVIDYPGIARRLGGIWWR